MNYLSCITGCLHASLSEVEERLLFFGSHNFSAIMANAVAVESAGTQTIQTDISQEQVQVFALLFFYLSVFYVYQRMNNKLSQRQKLDNKAKFQKLNKAA